MITHQFAIHIDFEVCTRLTDFSLVHVFSQIANEAETNEKILK